jgi:RNA polymerase sigma-70 factor (ECF subfamily)
MDQKLFANLFVQHRKDFMRFALWLTRNQDDAEDLVQEAYCYAWRRLENIPEESRPFVRWMFTGIRFLRQKALRAVKRESKVYTRFESQAEIDLVQNGPDADAVLRPYRFMVFDAVRKLPKMYRTPLFLHEVLDYPYEELSKIENVIEGTIKSRLYRGRNILRRRLQSIAQEENFSSQKCSPARKSSVSA